MTGVAYQFDFTGLLKGRSARARRQVLQAGTLIFRQGDPAEAIYFLLSGKIKMSAVSTQGKEAIVTILEADEFFGEACLLGYDAQLLNAVALVDSCVLKIPKDIAREWLGENVGFDEFLLTHVIRSRLRTEDQLLDRTFHSSEKRLAKALLSLANFGRTDTADVNVPKFSQEVLAEMVGTTRPRVNQFMNKFRKLGYIDYDGSKITVRRTLQTALFGEDQSEPDEDGA